MNNQEPTISEEKQNHKREAPNSIKRTKIKSKKELTKQTEADTLLSTVYSNRVQYPWNKSPRPLRNLKFDN